MQIETCFRDTADVHASVQKYVAAVSANLNSLTNKMVWNAHCRATNLLFNAGNDVAPFWDVYRFDLSIFEEFSPANTVPVARKMNESWHRMVPEPIMVRYTKRDYPIGHHSSPFEEIDEVAGTLFSNEGLGELLPLGRPVEPPSARKSKGRGLSGAKVRSPVRITSRKNWLVSLLPPPIAYEHGNSPASEPIPGTLLKDSNSVCKPKTSSHKCNFQDDHLKNVAPPAALTKPPPSNINTSTGDLSRLEQRFEQLGPDALRFDPRDGGIPFRNDTSEPVSTWPIRLFQDHKQRLARNLPQVLRRVLPGVRDVLTAARSQGFSPTDPSLEELIIAVEGRQRAVATTQATSEDIVSTIETPVEEQSRVQNETQHGKKRKRDQTGIIMFNKLVEPTKKKRKADAASLGTESCLSSKGATRTRKQNSSNTRLSNSEPRRSKGTPARQQATQDVIASSIDTIPAPPHTSGSSTLEFHQQLPSAAYFHPKSPAETPVWRCGVNHALGYYYIAGDRKNCPGCFTARSDNNKAKIMDFYLPSRTHFHQHNPSHKWRPSKLHRKNRRCTTLSHNSIAKEAYWFAIASGSSEDDAYTIALGAITEHLKAKVRREPTPEPTPESEPDLGPHPSGSATMEHGQDIPECAYFEEREQQDELTWRCDVNHALGRYYLAGDKRTCPGCGSNKSGMGKRARLDFYMPSGVVVRQEVEEVKWKPRKPYKTKDRKEKDPKKKITPTHNQIASKLYWEAIDAGQNSEAAFMFAIRETDKRLDKEEADTLQKIEERAKPRAMTPARKRNATASASASSVSTRHGTKQLALQQHIPSESADSDDGTTAGYTVSYGRQVNHDDLSDEEMNDATEDQIEQQVGPVEKVIDTSSDDASSSSSDSE